MNIYVGNLSFKVTGDDLRIAFSNYGDVASARVVIDSDTGRSKGFGFVEMQNSTQAQAAIKALNSTELQGRAMRINEARSR
jgi:RNA recognition motif-containing protein